MAREAGKVSRQLLLRAILSTQLFSFPERKGLCVLTPGLRD